MADKLLTKRKKHPELPATGLLAGILVFTCLLYLESLHGKFLSYDDTENVVDNVMARQLSPDHLWHLFSGATLFMYTPLTFISYAFDFQFSGPDPYFFKLTNLLLHLINVTLLYLIATRLLKNKTAASIITVFFAVHPMNVDSVSWISARSNLLSTLFILLALWLYLRYLNEKKIILLVLVTLSYSLSLLSKSSGIMLPVILLLTDYLNHRKITFRAVLEKMPLFLLSFIFGIVAVYFRSDSGNPQSIIEYTLTDRILMVCYAPAGYIFNTLLPFNLSAVYAYPAKTGGFLPIQYYLAPLFFAGIIFFIFRLKVLRREVVFGLLFFLINLLPTQLVLLEDGFLANRYGYLPCIGLLFIIAEGYKHFIKGSGWLKIAYPIFMAPGVLLFSFMTFQRSQVWKDNLTLFNDVTSHAPGSAFGFNNRGIARYAENNMEGALSDYDQAIALFPRYSGAFYNRGIVLYNIKEFGRANDDYTRAIALNPNFASSYMARGILEMDVLQNDSLALNDYNKALLINPAMAQAYFNRGILWLRMKQIQTACEDFHQVRRLGYSRADELIRQFCE